MYCNKCGKQNDEDSVYCQFCGNKIVVDITESQLENSSHAEEKKKDLLKESKSDLLWGKFVEVYDAVDKERERFDAFSSPSVWELLERLSVNAFENFIQDNKEELNKQPYKTIEALKNVYIWSVLGGYRLWLAEALQENKELNNFKSFSLDELIDEWKKFDFDESLKTLSTEMDIGITRYSNFRFDCFMENAPEAKEVSNAIVERLKSSLLLQTLNGYNAGKIENTFRK